MNREYRKFNEATDVYIPPATEPGHFSNLPDVLIPADYKEDEGDPLEKDVADLIRETKSPPPTPPELEPGRAGCRVFRDVKHYVAPIFSDDQYQRTFTTKLITGYMITYMPTVIVMIIVIILRNDFDFFILNNPRYYMVLGFVLTVLTTVVYVYFVGLFRNPPMLYVALCIRTTLNTAFFCFGMTLIHMSFLDIVAHPVSEEAKHNLTQTKEAAATLGGLIPNLDHDHDFADDHPPPYMPVLITFLMWVVLGTIAVLMYKLKYPVNDHRIPFIIYTTCFSMSSILTTIVLNGGFHQTPVAYDLFQVIFGCFAASMLLMRTPRFTDRLYDGKVCPLREGELIYALNHYNL